MSRVLLLSMSEGQVVKTCEAEGVLISTIEPLLSGGVRLVCSTMAGAEILRGKCKKQIIHTPVVRTAFWESRRLS